MYNGQLVSAARVREASGGMKLDFSCNGIPAGYFVGRDAFPRSPGEYRYMPYRSQGHLALQTSRDAPTPCEYVEGDVVSIFYARPGSVYGVLVIEVFGRAGSE